MKKLSDKIKRVIFLLRYHTDRPTQKYPIFDSCQRIANGLGITLNQVEHVCRHHFAKLVPKKK